jgi:hypothetical protein
MTTLLRGKGCQVQEVVRTVPKRFDNVLIRDSVDLS